MSNGGPARAAAAAAAALLLVYLATLAPGVTLWDAGEFAAAVESLGIPHPPGTPLYVLAARAWRLLLPWIATALATNLFAAVCTAGAAAIVAALVARWTRDTLGGAAAGIAAGSFSTVWLSATETEVYSAALLLSLATIWVAERVGASRSAAEAAELSAVRGVVYGRASTRGVLLVAYLFALAPPLHLSALVAAPAAALLAATDLAERVSGRHLAVLIGAAVLSTGIGTVSPAIVAAGAGIVLAGACWPGDRPLAHRLRAAAGVFGVVALGASVLAFLIVRAAHDPAINQGNPSTLAGLLDVVSRRQYDVPGLWPRQAPYWLQLGNLVQYADWQIALGLDQWVGPSWTRTPFTLAFAALGAVGALAHLRADRRSWGGMLVLFASATVGVATYLNLKAGPSYGYGILPDDAPREARERDYFFALAFTVWGAWAGLGAVRLARRLGRRLGVPTVAWAGVAVAAAPVALNWRAVDRGKEPDASLPRAFAHALLLTAPPNAVLFVAGDNDTYPLWYAQLAEGVRRDVTLVTVPLIGAAWYRAELARRDSLYAPADTAGWRGVREELASIARKATEQGRPVAASVGLSPEERSALGAAWTFHGLVYVRRNEGSDGGGAAPVADGVEAEAAMEAVRRLLPGPADPARVDDSAERYLISLLRCPRLARAAAAGGAGHHDPLLASVCNFR